MRFCILILLGLVAGPALAACPYAEQLAARSDMFSETPRDDRPVRGRQATGKNGVFFMNRIGPSSSTLYIANADGSNEKALLATSDAVFEYHGHFSPDGKYITFTSERTDGNSDLYRVNADGSNLTQILGTSSFEDNGVMSPDGTKLAYVSTANGFVTNIWVMDLTTGLASNLTNTASTVGESTELSPDGHYRPQWSPDGEWILFASDRNTDWTGHSNGTGWEHTQELSVYAIRPNGSDFKQVATKSGYSLGSPAWSIDGSRIAYYEITREDTYNAHSISSVNSTSSQIVSVDFATGLDRIEHTSGVGVKMSAVWVSNDTLGYLVKGVPQEGINYTSYTAAHQQWISSVRNPSWSPDRSKVIYERTGWDIRPLEKTLYSWQADYEYRFMDVFPQLSLQGKMAYTAKQTGGGNGSIVNSNPDGSDLVLTFDTFSTNEVNATYVYEGLSGAFQPAWSPKGDEIAFGLGSWFFERDIFTAWLYRATTNGSSYEELTDGTHNAGFPSYSPDGEQLVYRAWDVSTGAPLGLKVMNLTDKSVRNLTAGWDNTPGWSPDGTKIVFTRQTNWTASYGGRWYADRFDVCTINPDGTELSVLTTSGANDAHAVWTADNRIMWNSGMYGFRDECAVYDDTFQPYGQILIMEKDGSNKTMLTDSMWEDSMPLYVPNEFLASDATTAMTKASSVTTSRAVISKAIPSTKSLGVFLGATAALVIWA